MWGGADEAQSIATIRSAIDRGATLIDTAPVYGFGRSEGDRRQGARRLVAPQGDDRHQGRTGLERRRSDTVAHRA
jgi:diketogulonate reductase-like aldo/keto reductase